MREVKYRCNRCKEVTSGEFLERSKLLVDELISVGKIIELSSYSGIGEFRYSPLDDLLRGNDNHVVYCNSCFKKLLRLHRAMVESARSVFVEETKKIFGGKYKCGSAADGRCDMRECLAYKGERADVLRTDDGIISVDELEMFLRCMDARGNKSNLIELK